MNYFLQLCSAVMFLLAFALATNARAANVARDFSNATSIDLVHGVNRISDFDGRGHQAQIVYAWRENMNAHGYGIYSVLMLRPDTKDDWNLVTFETHDNKRKGGSEIDSISDEPFDGEEIVASVRFLKANQNGRPVALAVTAERDLSHTESFVDPTPVRFSIYRLVANVDGMPGWPFHYFERVDHFKSDRQYCNSDMALAKELRLRLPKDYEGPQNDDGCIR